MKAQHSLHKGHVRMLVANNEETTGSSFEFCCVHVCAVHVNALFPHGEM